MFFVEHSEGFLGDAHSALGLALLFFLLDFGFEFGEGFLSLIFGIRFFFGSMFFSIVFEPVDSKVDSIGRSFLDNVVDKWLDENVHLRADVLLNF